MKYEIRIYILYLVRREYENILASLPPYFGESLGLQVDATIAEKPSGRAGVISIRRETGMCYFLTVPFWDSVPDLWVSFQRLRRIKEFHLKTARIYGQAALGLGFGSCHTVLIILRRPQCRNGIEVYTCVAIAFNLSRE